MTAAAGVGGDGKMGPWPAGVTRDGRGTIARSGGSAPIPGPRFDTSRWPATVPAVEQLLSEGLELPAGLTVLVGENGSGKSTVMEMLARACGLNPQGGSAAGQLFRVRDSEPEAGAQLIVERGPVRPRWSYFLRADTMHSLYTYLEENPGPAGSASMS